MKLHSVLQALIYDNAGGSLEGRLSVPAHKRAGVLHLDPAGYMRHAHPQGARDVVFAISSPGQQVVEMPTYPLQLTCLGVIYGTPALAAIFVVLRIYTRRKLNLRLSWGESRATERALATDDVCR
jgi:hypothetical protein